MSNILIVDDEKEIADLLEVHLKNENYNNHSDNSPLLVGNIEEDDIVKRRYK